MKVNRAIAMRISKLLRERKMSQYRLEMKSGVLHGTLSGIMYEKSKNVGINNLILIAQGFGMSIKDFFDDPLFNNENLEIE